MDIHKNYQVSTEQYQNKYKSKHWKKYDLRSNLFKKENLINFRNNRLSDELLKIKKITYYFIIKEKVIEFKTSLLRLIKTVIKKFLFIK